jgi:hypothetical protein
MRRLFAFLVFLLGLALGVGYPMLAARLPAAQIGTWPVHARADGFMPVGARLTPDQAPVEVYVDLAASGSPEFKADRAVLTLTASAAGKTVLAEPLTFMDAVKRDDTPQTPELIYRTKAGVIETVDPEASLYTFTTGPGDAEGIDLGKVDLVLEKGPRGADPRAQPIGFIVTAIGAVAFLLSFRSDRGTPPNPNSKPPPKRWGRAAADRK